MTKNLCLYVERRFAKLGFSAAAVLNALPLLRELLDETHKNNLLVQACRIYASSDLIESELRVLGYFKQKVTLPYLNMLEQEGNKQKRLV